jgi:hypothetical protein
MSVELSGRYRFSALLRLLDSESILGIGSKLANSGSFFVSAMLTSVYLSLEQQGLFFTLLSFATLTVIVELGLNTVIIQFTSHEIALIDHSPDEEARAGVSSRLRSIGRFAFFWFWCGAVIFFVLVGAAGFVFFHGVRDANAVLPGPWIALVFLVAIDLSLNPFWSLLEGARRISTVYGYRMAKALLMGAGTWLALIMGLGLWALPIGFLVTLPLALWPIATNKAFFLTFLAQPDRGAVSWTSEIMPLQARLALSWVSGYFAQWALTPITLKLFGSAIAGQVGLSLALAGGISTIAYSVVQVKSARFGHLVATRQFAALDKVALRQGAIAFVLSLLGSLVLLGIAIAVDHLGYRVAHRLLPPQILAVFLFGSILQQATLPLAVYLRAFKREPFMWVSVMSALLLALALSVGGILFGIRGFALGYLFSAAAISPVSVTIFLRCRARWTVQLPPPSEVEVELAQAPLP